MENFKKHTITNGVKKLLAELAEGNIFGERVTLVAATKTRTPEEIQQAIDAGVSDIGENKAQEFREKYDMIRGGNRHFIGHLQTNKVKYLVGKTHLIHSVDRDELAEEIARRAQKLGIVQNVLIQINIGCEQTKGGYPLKRGLETFERLKETEGLSPLGFMAMLPDSKDEALLGELADRMRALFDEAKKSDPRVAYLSMGMSGDWRLCLRHGANMIRLGTAIFGERVY
ncbi:MAG: YggS family pyridoxal phosphate-dependent enzyme [Clostridia bacterium]|nr:YggS family pyridoxal phosphate-dependent enzyme [Clostridia bacterium]